MKFRTTELLGICIVHIKCPCAHTELNPQNTQQGTNGKKEKKHDHGKVNGPITFVKRRILYTGIHLHTPA